MPRKPRFVVPGLPHHLTQRGNNGEDIFRSDCDRQLYLSILKNKSEKSDFKVLGFCLMSNHVHIIGIPLRENSMARLIRACHTYYARKFNEKYGRKGHLWHSRFYSCALGEKHLYAALRYVDQNPVRSKMVDIAWEYKWSSALAHVSGRDHTGLISYDYLEFEPDGWKEILSEYYDDAEIELVRKYTQTGRPYL